MQMSFKDLLDAGGIIPELIAHLDDRGIHRVDVLASYVDTRQNVRQVLVGPCRETTLERNETAYRAQSAKLIGRWILAGKRPSTKR